MLDADDISTMLEDCEKRESKLTEWEATFIDSLSSQYIKRGSLSEKQCDIPEKIWDRVTG